MTTENEDLLELACERNDLGLAWAQTPIGPSVVLTGDTWAFSVIGETREHASALALAVLAERLPDVCPDCLGVRVVPDSYYGQSACGNCCEPDEPDFHPSDAAQREAAWRALK